MAIYEHMKEILGEGKLEKAKEKFWGLPIPDNLKGKLYFALRSNLKDEASGKKGTRDNLLGEYVSALLAQQDLNNSFSINYPKEAFIKWEKEDPKLIAYYLPQFYPDPHNTEWWGRGTTEWTNVSKAVPQYLGHDQPHLPGELGYYDLRVKENMYRQIELAKFYGIYGFCFYFYWFDGERLLDLPFNAFVNDKSIDFPFSICWVNESWTRQWSEASDTPLIVQNASEESYKAFIESCVDLFSLPNYIRVKGCPIFTVYRPRHIPNPREVISYWRKYVKEKTGLELYIIASLGSAREERESAKYLEQGFDACSEFAIGPQLSYMKKITSTKEFVCENFEGEIYDYKDLVETKGYLKLPNHKIYRAISPMWDNTARKKNRGLILDGSTPELYKQWLFDIIQETKENHTTEDNLIFVNAWNEWAEGAYLEPDLRWKYGYLEATRDAILQARDAQIDSKLKTGRVTTG